MIQLVRLDNLSNFPKGSAPAKFISTKCIGPERGEHKTRITTLFRLIRSLIVSPLTLQLTHFKACGQT